jgi:hypothetical protein
MSIMRHQVGYFGNIWVRENRLPVAGESTQGHYHKFDHVSLLVLGVVEIQIEGHEPKQFIAPTFIVIKKKHSHKFIAVSDNVVWYCVFALRDVNGEITDIYNDDNSPYGAVTKDYWDKQELLEKSTTFLSEKDRNGTN